ncbi:MAG: ABC transporter substrate-binding protein [Candidatus Tectomicrobia bacterium]|nr:ABC transporter substrate-binding protein [Candidatus Tectomicrobia bacterium]
MKGRGLRFVLGVVAWLSLAGAVAAADSVRFALNWIMTSEHTGFQVALEKGFFKESGLDVNMTRGFGSGDTIKRTAAGATDLGFADAGSLIIGRAKGAAVKAIGVVYAKNPHAIMTLDKSGIRTIADLKGRTMGCQAGNANAVLFPVLAQSNRLDAASVKMVAMDIGTSVPSLIQEKVDSICLFVIEAPLVARRAKTVNKSLRVLEYKDFGVNIYSNGLIASDKMVQASSQLLGRFVKAALRGWVWTYENPREALAISMKQTGEKDPDAARERLEIIRDLMVDEGVEKNGIGYMAPEKMTRTRDIVLKTAGITQNVALGEIYSNAFLPGTRLRKR